MSKRPLKTIAPNEVYKAELRKFIEEIENNRSLAMIYSFTKVHYELHKEERRANEHRSIKQDHLGMC